MGQIYDLIILGSGPAGLSAAIYAARAELNTLVIEKAPVSGGQIINTSDVDNYLGLPGINGYDMAVKFREHCDKFQVPFVEGEVASISYIGNIKKIILANGIEYQAYTIIIATGAIHRNLGVKGEEELSGCGVSYCATCDGAFFRGRTTAVIGGGDVALEDAIFLSRLCQKVYLIHRRDEFRAAKVLVSKAISLPNIEILYDTTVKEISGDDCVSGLKLFNVKSNVDFDIAVDGVFLAVGTKPVTDFCAPEIIKDKGGYIEAGEDCATSVPGIYAAGDVRSKPLRQIITAAADGANAVASVEKYISVVKP